MKITSYKEGTPCWIDLATPDVPAAVAFYSGLFGWVGNESPPEAGGYVICNLGDEPVAGIGPFMGDAQPSAWSTYFAVDDLDDTAARVEKAGGQVLMPPMDVMDAGRMGVFIDTSGAVFGAWQKITFGGAGVANEPGALTWNELMTRDVEGSKAFYGAALGLGSKVGEMSPASPYTDWLVGDASVASMSTLDMPQFPPDLPSHWMVYFAVADINASAAKVAELGGTISVPPTEIPIGTFAVAADPAGAFFSMIQMAG